MHVQELKDLRKETSSIEQEKAELKIVEEALLGRQKKIEDLCDQYKKEITETRLKILKRQRQVDQTQAEIDDIQETIDQITGKVTTKKEDKKTNSLVSKRILEERKKRQRQLLKLRLA